MIIAKIVLCDKLENYHKVLKNGYLYIGYDVTHEFENENGFDIKLIYIDVNFITNVLELKDNNVKLFKFSNKL